MHWRVHVPPSVSQNKGFLRAWAGRRVRNALRARLAEVEVGMGRGREGLEGGLLTGALLVVLAKGAVALTASKEEVRESVGWVVDAVLRQRERDMRSGRRRGEKG